MSAPVPRFDGADLWARLSPQTRDHIGRCVVEMVAAERWAETFRPADPDDEEAIARAMEERLIRMLLAARAAALGELRRAVVRAGFERGGLDPDAPAIPWAAGRVCASCGRTEAGDPSAGWIGATCCEHCPPGGEAGRVEAGPGR